MWGRAAKSCKCARTAQRIVRNGSEYRRRWLSNAPTGEKTDAAPIRHAKWKAWRLPMAELEQQLFVKSQKGETTPAEELRTQFPWGLLRQDLVESLVKEKHENSQNTKSEPDIHPADSIQADLIEKVGGRVGLEEGVQQSYMFFVENFNSLNTRWEELDIATPPLSALLSLQADLYKQGKVIPLVSVEKQDVQVKLLNIWMEQGSADRPGKLWGMFDPDEIKYHLLSGFIGPELGLFANIPGKPPRRIAAAFRIKSLESFNTKQLDHDNPSCSSEEKKESYHYLVFETDWKDDKVQWRVRNMNDAIIAKEGAKELN